MMSCVEALVCNAKRAVTITTDFARSFRYNRARYASGILSFPEEKIQGAFMSANHPIDDKSPP